MHTDPKIQAMPSETISPMKTRSLISLLCLLLCSCSSWLPPLEERTESRHFNTSKPVLLDNILQIRHTPHNNGLSDIYLLDDPHEAFAARAALIESAEHSLDLQYYIWRNDISGRLLFNLMYLAAERGVRVRLLLDDNNTRGLDDLLLALDSHPNIEVRLFNPFVLRKWRALGYLTDFPRLNRRMHNKSFTADNRATILG
ncbi:phospholipase D family protein, partial [Neisseria gonorrhoeae]